MKKDLPIRFWAEVVSASLTGLLAVVTPFWPDWIEAISGWDPDAHDGSVEWMIALGLFVVTAAIFSFAALEWRRAPNAAPA